jgi:hypothetical protein
MTDTYTTKNSAFAVVPQPAGVYGLRQATPPIVEATSDGAADGSTVIATGLGPFASGDDDFVGNILECSYASDRRNRNKRSMVVAYDHATTTLTVDALPEQVKDGDRFYMYETPDAPIVVDVAGTVETTFQDATRDEVDDYWNGTEEEGGYYAVVRKADLLSTGELSRITDFVSTNGVFTGSPAFSDLTKIGDLLHLMKFIEARGGLTADRPPITREAHIGVFGTIEQEAGLRAGSGSLELYRRGPGYGREGLPAEAHDMLRCTMTYLAGVTDTAVAGSSGDQIKYSAGNFVPGQFMLTPQGELCMVIADDGAGTYTVDPAPRILPGAGDILGLVATYQPSSQLNIAVTVYQWIGGLRTIFRAFYGCVPIVTIGAQMNQYGNLSFAITAADWYEATLDETGQALARQFCARWPSVAPRKTNNMRCNVGGVEFPLTSYTFTPAQTNFMVPNGTAPNWTDGGALTNEAPMFELVCTLTPTTRRALDDRISYGQIPMLIQDGMIPGDPGIMGVWAQGVQFDTVPPSDNSGIQQITISGRVIAQPCQQYPAWALGLA